jgi:hypothetical protein
VAIELNEFNNELLRSIAQTDRSRISGKDPQLFYRVAMSDPVNADAEFIIATRRRASPGISPRLCSEPKSTTRTADFEIGRQNLANHEVSNWLEQSIGEKDRRLTAA